MSLPFADRLASAVRSKHSALVVGLDPQLAKLPVEIRERATAHHADQREAAAAAIKEFDAAVIEEVAPFAAAVKPQIAYYERWGPPGLAAYEHAIEKAHAAGLLVIGDIKRGDIGPTAEAYASAHLGSGTKADRDRFADAITVNPYFGTDGLQPFLNAVRERDAGLFVLVRTSNASAGELQDLPALGQPVHEHIAARVVAWGHELTGSCGYSSVGAVVGATAPRELARLRECMPRTWFLIPGVGAQGGTAADVAPAFDSDGLGALVNSSRGIIFAFGSPAASEWRRSIREAARHLRDELRTAAPQAAS